MRYLLIGLLLVSVAVLAEGNGTVILASDNQADLTAAEAAASFDSNATVISTPWGEDSNSTIESILAKDPKEIIIIGGPVAIPDALELRLRERLNGSNVTIVRVYGNDRYGTAAEIASHFWGNVSGVVMVQGDDSQEMRRRLLEAENDRVPVLYMRSDGIPDPVKEKLRVWKLNSTRLYLSPDSNESAISRDLNETEDTNVSSSRENSTERALEAIKDAKEKVAEAEAAINLTVQPDNASIAASRLLVLAQNEYADANASFENGSYGRAFGQAVAAQAHAEDSVKIYEHVIAGDYSAEVKKASEDISSHGIGQVLREARKELEKAGNATSSDHGGNGGSSDNRTSSETGSSGASSDNRTSGSGGSSSDTGTSGSGGASGDSGSRGSGQSSDSGSGGSSADSGSGSASGGSSSGGY